MNNTDLHLHIPPEIVALPGLTLDERVVLANVHELPACSNASLARLLGLSERGIESMLRRLRDRGLIQQVGKGRARQHRLLFRVEHHTGCGQNEYAESHIKRGQNNTAESHTLRGEQKAAANPDRPMPAPTQPAAPGNEETSSSKVVEREIESAIDCVGRGDFGGALGHYRSVRQIIAALPDSVPGVKAEALATVIEDETRALAFGLVFQYAKATNMPGLKLKALFATIKGLSAERLVQIRPVLDEHAQLGRPVDISTLLAE